MVFENILNLVFLSISLIVSLILILRTSKYRNKPLGIFAFVLALGLAFWFVTSFLEQVSFYLPLQLVALKLSYLGLSVVALAFLAFVIRYTNRNKEISRNTEIFTLAFLSLIPLATTVIIWTNDIHHLMWARVFWDDSFSPPLIQTQNNLWYWVNLTYVYAVFAAGIIFLILHFIQLKGIYRKQAAQILTVVCVSAVFNILHSFQIEPFKVLDLTPLAFSISGAFFFFNLSTYKLLNIVPIAHDTVFNTIGDGVFVLDEENNIIDLNSTAENIFKRNKQDMVGQSYSAAFASYPDMPEPKPWLKEVQTSITILDGTERFYEVRLTQMLVNERFNGHLLLLHDDTERRKLEDEAEKRIRLETQLDEREKANQQLEIKVNQRTEALMEAVAIAEASSEAKAKFLANMSHELRTPLAAIIGFAQMLQDEHVGALNVKQADYVDEIIGSGQHLLSLINDVLDLSRAQEGKMEMEKSPVNIKNILQTSEAMFADRVRANNIGIKMELSPDIEGLVVNADQRRIKQVMLNLLSNAVKFSPNGGTITISANRKDNELFINVTDTGIGISPEEQKNIFTEFYQVNNDIRKNTAGTGLGLIICKNIIEKHGGKIWVESEGLNKGSSFAFTLPL